MNIDDEIRKLLGQADALKAIGVAQQALEKATEAYRKKPTPKTKEAYRQANEALADVRRESRADRPLGVGGDAFIAEGAES